MDIRLASAPIRTPEEVYRHLVARGAMDPIGKPGFLRELVFTAYEVGDALNLNADWMIAQGCLESGDKEKGHPPFVSKIYRERGMHVGMGVTDFEDLGYGFANGREAIYGQAAHLYLYVYGEKLPKGWEFLKDKDPRWKNVLAKEWQGTVTTVDDLAGKWATDRAYGTKLRSRFQTYIEGAPRLPESGGDDMVTTFKRYKVQGAPRELILPSTLQVHIEYIKHPNVTNQRVRTPKTSTTYHDTGNPRTNAAGEFAWLKGGRQGGEAGGYNWIVDDVRLYITGPFNWETWHAGVPEGNWYSLGGEHAFGGQVVWQKSLDNACWMQAAVIECYGWSVTSHFKWHRAWYGKYCPGQIFNRGLESWVMAKIAQNVTALKAVRAGNDVPAPDPVDEWATPVLPLMAGNVPWDGKEDLVTSTGVKFEAQREKGKILNDVNMRQWANTESLFTGPGYKAGSEVEFLGWVQGELVGDISEWWIDTKGNRVWAGAVDLEPKIDPDYGQHPETPPGIVPVNGRLYYPLYDEDTGQLGRKITVHRDGSLYKWAGVTSGEVGTVKDGDERVFKYWTRGEELPLVTQSGEEAMEGIWFAEDVFSGARMWSGLSEERPD